MIFKKKSLLAIAAMFMAGSLFIGCSDDDDDIVGFVAVTDITNVPGTLTSGETLTGNVVPAGATNRTIVWSVYEAGTTAPGAQINGNVLTAEEAGLVVVRATIANGAAEGTPFVLNFNVNVSVQQDIGNSARIYAFDGDGNQVIITVVHDGGWATDSASMLHVLGTGRMVAAFDANLASTEGDGDYFAAIETPFVVQGDNAQIVDLSSLTGIRVRGRTQGSAFFSIKTPLINWDAHGTWAQWGWVIGEARPDAGDAEWIHVDRVFSVSEMERINAQWCPSTVTAAEALAQAEAFSIELNTEVDVRADIDISEIWLVFADEASIPAVFGTGTTGAEVLLDDFAERSTDGEPATWTNQNALTERGVTNAGTWYGYSSEN